MIALSDCTKRRSKVDETFGKIILAALAERLKGRKIVCGLCGGTRWGVEGAINLPVQNSVSSGLVIGGPSLPLVSLTCEICGNTEFLSIIRLIGKEKFEQMRTQPLVLNEAEKILKEKEGKPD